MKHRSSPMRLTLALAALLWLPLAAPVHAREDQSAQPIRFIVPYAAAGLPDTLIRRIGSKLSTQLGQTVIIENKPGAGGLIAVQTLQASPADGHTYIFSDSAFMSITPLTMKSVPYDPKTDFVPVSLVARAPNFLAVNSSVPANSLAEFIALAKSKPNGITCGSSGVGTLHHLTLEMMKLKLNIDLVHVPFRGSSQSVPAMAGGQIQCTLAALPSLVGFAQNGKAKILALASSQRSPLAPEVPPMYSEKDAYDFAFLLGAVAKPGTPDAAIKRLSGALAVVVKDPELISSLRAIGVEPAGESPEAYAAALRQDAQQMAAAAKLAGIHPE